MDSSGGNRGVLLAIAIILLWLAGLCFFIAFEGSKLLGSSGLAGGDSETIIGRIEEGLAKQVQDGTATMTTGNEAGA